MRTAITLSKTHAGKWALVAGPDVPMLEQKSEFRELRAAKSHPDFSEFVYQENDGHRETIRLMTPDDHKKQEKKTADDIAAAKKFDEENAKKKRTNPEREKAEKDFAEATKAAEAEEASNKTKK